MTAAKFRAFSTFVDARNASRPSAGKFALFDITQHSCATQVALRTGRLAHTVIRWVHACNAQGLEALAFHRTGGRRPLISLHRR